jgi:hypothetical protein
VEGGRGLSGRGKSRIREAGIGPSGGSKKDGWAAPGLGPGVAELTAPLRVR